VDLTATIAGLSCALLSAETSPSRKSVSGLLANDQVATLRQAFRLVNAVTQNWSVESFDRSLVYCQALDALRPAAAGSNAGSAGLDLKLVQPNADNALHDGDLVRVQVGMPDFGGWLVVDYITSDGEVAHMLPRWAGDQAYPPLDLAARARKTLFEPAGAFKGWVAGEPYGTDMIIAVAASDKLFPEARPDDEQQASDYLAALRDAIDAARKRGVRVAAAAILVNTLPKRGP
jgi:hypothetical protein